MIPEPRETSLDVTEQAVAEAPPRGGKETLRRFENLVANPQTPTYVLRLFVSGTSQRSSLAITSVRRLCEEHLAGRYELEVVDVYQQPEAARSAEVIAIPTLIKESPAPAQRIVGDMSSAEKLLGGLKLKAEVDHACGLNGE
jgi:circadian clock protein KaiB